ncbi:MAG: glycosyltransferase subfamily GT2 protein [Ignavibacteria bacterium]|nr:glycosyltransferase subfamily GT2 protein [Ignavibacteria bacterium]MDP3829846.1 hypothetical protein [Ignavibacteriaceae bacterium]
MKTKIGVGIITCNRPGFFVKCINSMPTIDKLVVVNDGKPYDKTAYESPINEIIQHEKNYGVAKSKNDAFKFLLNEGCTDIFICEDDITLSDSRIFDVYINTAHKTGILHFNYAFHGNANRDSSGNPITRKILEYGDSSICLNKHIVGAFSYYHREVIEKVGLMNEAYYNGLEHIEHTYEIIKHGFHPPFWWFADIENSYNYITELDVNLHQSVIRKSFWSKYYNLKNKYIFKSKYGFTPWQIPDTIEDEVLNSIEKIKINYNEKNKN